MHPIGRWFADDTLGLRTCTDGLHAAPGTFMRLANLDGLLSTAGLFTMPRWWRVAVAGARRFEVMHDAIRHVLYGPSLLRTTPLPSSIRGFRCLPEVGSDGCILLQEVRPDCSQLQLLLRIAASLRPGRIIEGCISRRAGTYCGARLLRMIFPIQRRLP